MRIWNEWFDGSDSIAEEPPGELLLAFSCLQFSSRAILVAIIEEQDTKLVTPFMHNDEIGLSILENLLAPRHKAGAEYSKRFATIRSVITTAKKKAV